jgi:hypothetical protein
MKQNEHDRRENHHEVYDSDRVKGNLSGGFGQVIIMPRVEACDEDLGDCHEDVVKFCARFRPLHRFGQGLNHFPAETHLNQHREGREEEVDG